MATMTSSECKPRIERQTRSILNTSPQNAWVIQHRFRDTTKLFSISFPGSSLFRRKDSGNSWSRGSQKIDCLRVCGKSIILHASTSALYTISRSVLWLCTINFKNHIYVKILAKFDFCLLLNYKNMLNRFLQQQVRKSSNKNVWSYALALKGTFISHVLLCLWFTYLQSYNMSLNCCYLERYIVNFALIYLLISTGLESDCMFIGRGAFEVFRQRLHIWTLAKYSNDIECPFYSF
jgi:hypothetical protein